MKNVSKGIENPRETLFRNPPEILSHLILQEGGLLVNQKSIGIMNQEILSCSPAVKGKNGPKAQIAS